VPRELLGGEAADATFAFLDEAQARLHGDISPSQPSATATEDEGVVPPTAAAPRAHHMESNERMTTSLSSYAATEDEIIPPSTAAARTANMESAEGRSTISAAQTAAEYAFKVLVVGSSSVGKSSLLCRLMDDTYNEDLPATYGVDLKFQSYLLDGVRIKLVFWDTAGQERFAALTPAYFRSAHALVLVFDLADRGSFDRGAPHWLRECERQCPEVGARLLIGNKVDKEHREVSVEEARSFAHSMEADYIETSCKDSTNVVDAFDALARLCRQQIGATEPAQNLEIGYALVPFAPRELLTDPLASDSVLAEQRSSGCSGGC